MKILKTLFGITVLVFLIWLVDVRQIVSAFSKVSAEAIGYLLFMSVVLIYVSALKWKLFLEALGGSVGVWRLFRLYVVGYFVNLVLPSYLAGDAVRSWYIGKEVGQHEALAGTILERYTGLVAMVLLGIGSSFLVPFVSWQIRLSMLCVGAVLVVATILALSARAMDFLDRAKLFRPVTRHLRKIQEGLLLARRDYMLLAKALIFSFAYHLLTVINTIVAARAVGWQHPPFLDLVIVIPLILIVGALPVSPNGLGIQEGAWLFFLQTAGATPAIAMGIALILRAKSYVIAGFGYFFWLAERRTQGAPR